MWTSEQFVLLSELVLDHPLASSLTAFLLTLTTCWWLVSFCCCRRLPTKRKGDKVYLLATIGFLKCDVAFVVVEYACLSYVVQANGIVFLGVFSLG